MNVKPTFPTIPWTAAFVGGFNTSEFGASTSDLLSIMASYVVPGTYVSKNRQITLHNSPIYDECQTQSAWVLALP